MQLYKYIIVQTFSTNQTRRCFSSGPDTSHVSMPIKVSVLLGGRQTEFISPKPAFGMDIYHLACSVCRLQGSCNRRNLSRIRKDSISLIIIIVSLKWPQLNPNIYRYSLRKKLCIWLRKGNTNSCFSTSDLRSQK